jgi:undecaprenyl-diphosphatase
MMTLAAVLFVVLAVRFAGTSTAGRVDVHVDAVVDPVANEHRLLIERVVTLGSTRWVVAFAVLLSVACLLLGRRRLAVLAVLGPGLTGACTSLLKPILGRTIDGGLAFPSGHTGGATALGLVAALLVISLVRPSRAGAMAIVAAASLIAGGGVGAAMVAANAHYPTDTIGGFCMAVVVVCGTALALDRIAERRPPSSETA